MSNRFQELLEQRPYLLADGATGTNLFAAGLVTGDAPELWNLEHPDRIAELHRSFIDAGSDIVLSNSFGGTHYRLKLHGAENWVTEINQAAARIARREADDAGRTVLVGGSMGPTGEILAPLGSLNPDKARAAFAEQAQALAEGGVDMLWIETMSSREELEAAVAGAGEAGLPVVCTMSFDTNGHTMMGLSPADLGALCQQLHPHPAACGSNCGVGPAELVAAILGLSEGAGAEQIFVAKANCGIPQWIDGEIRYSGTPELMAEYARLAVDAGARVVGGCCGTTPEHIRAMKSALESHVKGSRPDLDTVVARLGEVSTGAKGAVSGDPDDDGSGAGARRKGTRRGRRVARNSPSLD